ncbi:MAG: aminotransferase class I/II-fold pyridoxal phosphate-dependent enzyme [Candidatus Dormibacteraeota bacterium]|nr:aminotransferase class I/II-fold pyridoxal phosphate-dependent enzyme [Candidatus Dormibacteraeota bacterium]
MNVPVRYHIRGRKAGEIAGSIERGIREGGFASGQRLPTVRSLSARLGVSAATVASAYRDLRQRGLVVASGRQGTTVAGFGPVAPRGRPSFAPGIRDLSGGNPDPELLPDLERHLRDVDAGSVLYGTPPSDPDLLRLVADRFKRDGVSADNLTVVGGALDGLERILGAHLRPGDRVAVEDPSYPGITDLVRTLGLQPVPVAVDDAGADPDSLFTALKAGVAACVVTPRAQNPYGCALDAGRAADLRSALRRFPEVLLVEDDHASEINDATGSSLSETPRSQHWAQVRSVSKSLGPDLRLAVLAGDATTIARVEGRRLIGAGWVSHLLQRLVVSLWRDPATEKILGRARRLYASRRTALIDSLARNGIEAHGRSGINVWVPVAHEDATVAALLERGWGVLAGERFRIASPRGIRVTTSTLEPDEAARFAGDLRAALEPQPSRLG